MDNTNQIVIRSTRELGRLIKDRRIKKNMTQQHFADLVGVGRRFLSDLENGKETAEFGKVLATIQALGTDLLISDR